MIKGDKKIFPLAFIILAALLSILLMATRNGKIITAVFMAIAAVAVFLLLKRRLPLSINKREVLLLTSVIAALFVILVLFSGLWFGFYKNPYFMKTNTLLTVALPIAVIIIATEIIRYVFISQKNGFISAVIFVSCVIAEALTALTIPEITSFNRFMDLVGLTLFPAILSNIFYHYSAKRFGVLPNIAFRMIIVLYVYFTPTASGMSEALLSCLKMILPIIMLMLVSAMYEKKQKKIPKKGSKLTVVGTVAAVTVVILVAMLISCQFR